MNEFRGNCQRAGKTYTENHTPVCSELKDGPRITPQILFKSTPVRSELKDALELREGKSKSYNYSSTRLQILKKLRKRKKVA